MEHIIQFGVSIDEDKIITVATDKASNEIKKVIQAEINKYVGGWRETKLDKLFREEIKKVIDENKEQIIENATKLLASNMTRTKAVKEKLADLEQEI